MLQITHNDIYLTPGISLSEQLSLGFKPRSDASHWPLKFPIDWLTNPFSDENWCFQLNAWRMIDPYLREWVKTNDSKYISDSFEYVRDWYKFVTNPSLIDGKHTWSDMATGIRALRLAFYLQLYKDGVFVPKYPDDLKLLNALIDLHALRLMDEKKLTLTNHGLFQIFGLNSLSIVAGERASLSGAFEYVDYAFNLLFEKQYTKQAVHKEHSPEYHAFVTTILINLGGNKFLKNPSVVNKINKAAEISKWFIFPGGRISMIGDSFKNIKTPAINVSVELDEIVDCGLIDKSLEGVVVNDLSESGYIIVRKLSSDDSIKSMLLFHGSCHSMVHKHADDLSFELFENGVMLIVDSGKYSYNSNSDRKYIISASAHSIPKIKNIEIAPNSVSNYGSALSTLVVSKDVVCLDGVVDRKNLFLHKRNIYYKPGFYLIVRDFINSSQPNDFLSELQINPDLKLVKFNGFFDLECDGEFVARVIQPDSSLEIKSRNGRVTSEYAKLKINNVIFCEAKFSSSFIDWVIIFNKTEDPIALDFLNKLAE